jgi:oxygen-independent coproporphyrinogen-3 oxidase
MELGINRLSLGIQSFDDAELKWMNRAHTAEDSRRSIHEIKAAGIHNFSVDVIFGSPLLQDEVLEKTMQLIIDEQITHISCYALTAEPKTALHKMIAVNKTTAPDPEIQARQFLLIADILQASGYEHYEISNYAKPGLRSKHNSSYWQGKAYHGFGAGAHAFNGKNKRRWNIANNALYIQQLKTGILPFEEETLSETQQLNEYVMTALRTAEGINLAVVAENFGAEKEQALKNKIFVGSFNERQNIVAEQSPAINKQKENYLPMVLRLNYFFSAETAFSGTGKVEQCRAPSAYSAEPVYPYV